MISTTRTIAKNSVALGQEEILLLPGWDLSVRELGAEGNFLVGLEVLIACRSLIRNTTECTNSTNLVEYEHTKSPILVVNLQPWRRAGGPEHRMLESTFLRMTVRRRNQDEQDKSYHEK